MGRAGGERGRMRGGSPGGRARARDGRRRAASGAPCSLSGLGTEGRDRLAPRPSTLHLRGPASETRGGRPSNSRDPVHKPISQCPSQVHVPRGQTYQLARRTDSHSPQVTDVHLKRNHLQLTNTLCCQTRHNQLEDAHRAASHTNTQTTPKALTPQVTQVPRFKDSCQTHTIHSTIH